MTGTLRLLACIVLLSAGLMVEQASARDTAKTSRIGVLYAGDKTSSLISGFLEGLKALGYRDGENIQIEYRLARGQFDRLPALARELVEVEVDVIVAVVTAASLAAQSATNKIPIVIIGGDPLGAGLIASLARPGGNLTGVSTQQANMVAKQVQLAMELQPHANRIAALWNPTNTAFQALQLKELQEAGTAFRLAVEAFPASRPDDFDPAFAAMREANCRALVILADPLFAANRSALASLAEKHGLITICGSRQLAEAGCVIGYGPSFFEAGKRAATYVQKILGGAKPDDLPVEQPTKFELIINLKAAKALSLTIPPTLLARADEVIE